MYEKQQESTRHDHRALATGEHEWKDEIEISLSATQRKWEVTVYGQKSP